jgi:hypothetical protein
MYIIVVCYFVKKLKESLFETDGLCKSNNED